MSLETYSPKNIWTLILNDWKRFWVIAVTEFFALFITSSSVLLMTPKKEWVDCLVDIINAGSFQNGAIAMLFPIVAAISVFRYLHSVNSVTAMHSLPISRREHFLGHLVSGYSLVAIPIIINGIILSVLSTVDVPANEVLRYTSENKTITLKGSDVFTFSMVCKVVLLMLLVAFVMYAFAVLAGMLTASRIMHVLAACVLIVLVPIMILVVDSNLEMFLKGYCTPNILEKIIEFFLPVIQINWASPLKIVLDLILAFGLLILSYIAYQKRTLECATEALAFKFMEPFLVGILSFIVASAVGEWFMGSEKTYYWGFAIGLVVSYFPLTMICEKTTRVFNRRNAKNGLILIGILAIVFATVRFDLIGYQHRIPEISGIDKVKINELKISFDGIPLIIDENWNEELESLKSIEAVRNMHKDLIRYSRSGNEDDDWIQFEYVNKFGEKIKRQYYFLRKNLEKIKGLKELYESKEFKKAYKVSNISALKDKRLCNVSIHKTTLENEDGEAEESWDVNAVDIDKLLYNMDLDFKDRTFIQEIDNKNWFEGDEWISISRDNEEDEYIEVDFRIHKTDTNTINFLREKGYLK